MFLNHSLTRAKCTWAVTICNYLELAVANKILDLRHGLDVPGTGGAGSQEEVSLQGCHHREGRVLALVGHGEDELMIVLGLLV